MIYIPIMADGDPVSLLELS